MRKSREVLRLKFEVGLFQHDWLEQRRPRLWQLLGERQRELIAFQVADLTGEKIIVQVSVFLFVELIGFSGGAAGDGMLHGQSRGAPVVEKFTGAQRNVLGLIVHVLTATGEADEGYTGERKKELAGSDLTESFN